MSDEQEPARKKRRRKKKRPVGEAEVAQPTEEAPSADATPTSPERRRLVIGVLGGLVVGAGGGFAGGYQYARRGRRRKPPPPLPPVQVELAPHTAVQGPRPAKVTLVVFTDFQCPFCARVVPTLDKLRETYPDELALALRHRTLEMHPHAEGAAMAFQAAHRQQKAWALHDIMFENRKALQRPDLVGYAKAIGLDVAAFEAALDDPAIREEVRTDDAYAKKVGVGGTPTSFINGKPVRGARPYESFDEIVKAEVEAADALLAGGTSLDDVYEARCKAHIAAFGKG